ncbi:MAG: amidohydrolase, partial [Mesorhizobium sp.]
MQADIVVTSAKILTMDPARPAASAMAVANGRILAVGDATEVLPFAGNLTRMIDAAGRSVLPGFIEAHMHVFGGGAILNDLLLTGTKGKTAIREKVRAHAAANPEAKVL